jgi:hypothetical protein
VDTRFDLRSVEERNIFLSCRESKDNSSVFQPRYPDFLLYNLTMKNTGIQTGKLISVFTFLVYLLA